MWRSLAFCNLKNFRRFLRAVHTCRTSSLPRMLTNYLITDIDLGAYGILTLLAIGCAGLHTSSQLLAFHAYYSTWCQIFQSQDRAAARSRIPIIRISALCCSVDKPSGLSSLSKTTGWCLPALLTCHRCDSDTKLDSCITSVLCAKHSGF
jgi:hypothetical protein